jgi:hypothetical protein
VGGTLARFHVVRRRTADLKALTANVRSRS